MVLKITTTLFFVLATLSVILSCIYNFSFSGDKNVCSSMKFSSQEKNVTIYSVPGFLDTFSSDVQIVVKSSSNVKLSSSIGYSNDVLGWVSDENNSNAISITGFSTLENLSYETRVKNLQNSYTGYEQKNSMNTNDDLDMWTNWQSNFGSVNFNFKNSDSQSYSLLLVADSQESGQNVGDIEISFYWQNQRNHFVLLAGLIIALIFYSFSLLLYVRIKQKNQKPTGKRFKTEQENVISQNSSNIVGLKETLLTNDHTDSTSTENNLPILIPDSGESFNVTHKVDTITIEKNSILTTSRKELRKQLRKRRFKK